jgi:uncharacterized membrane protein YagU involved in acid resistance
MGIMFRHPINRFLAGALAGLVATVPQTIAMEIARRKTPMRSPSRFPPRQVTEEVLSLITPGKGPPSLSESAWQAITTVSHFGYGATMGSLYPLMPARPRNVALRGTVFGLTVWAGSYGVVLPLMGIFAPQADRPVHKNLQLAAAHLAWGVATAELFEWFSKRARAAPRRRGG